jgi:long-chain acyl-CoA synthetase
MYNDIKNLVDLMYNSAKLYGDSIFLNYKQNGVFIPIKFSEFPVIVEELAASFYDIGIKKGDKVAIISDNLYKWFITDMAILSLGAIDIPRGSDTTPQELSYILKHSDTKFCVVEDIKEADKVLSTIENFPDIKKMILLVGNIDDVKNENKNKVELYHFDDLLQNGKTLKMKHADILKNYRESIKDSDIVTLIYTSGTTGMPKGVMLSHRNLIFNVHAYTEVLIVHPGKDRWLSVLPVWHVFERAIEYIAMGMGAMLAYSKPTAKHLLPDLAEIKPTLLAAVPRIWESLQQGIVANMKKEPALKQNIFNISIKIGTMYSQSMKVFRGKEPLFKHEFFLTFLFKRTIALFLIIFLFIPDLIADVLVFSTIRKKTGGLLKQPISGGGALPEKVDTFFAAIKMNLHEGYGLSETSPIISVRNKKSMVSKTVGFPAPGLELMIGDDEWNKKANQHRKGLIYVKGPLVMEGYYKDEKKTNDVLKNDWLNTGDLGRLTIKGSIQIVGRAKETIVLTGGENIEPTPIEEKLSENPLINQVMVVGQDRKALGALIIPEKNKIEEFAQNHHLQYKTYRELLDNPKVIEEISKIVKHQISSWNGFKNFEKITCFKLMEKPFDVNDELTSTLKMKRNYIAKKYSDIINSLYN